MSQDLPLEPEIAGIFDRLHGQGWARSLERSPLISPESATGAALERIAFQVHGNVVRYVVKRLTPLGDWLSRATDDRDMREHQIVAEGVFNEMPPHVASATIASTLTAPGAAIVMRDVTHALMPAGEAHPTMAQLRTAIAGLARMHSAFAGFPDDRAERIGLNRLGTWLTPLSPATARREEKQQPRDAFTPLIDPGWQAFQVLAPETWELIGPLLDDPKPVVAALSEFTPTLVHGDVKAANLAVEGDTLILLDWSTTTAGPGALDLAWYLCINAHRLPCPKADVIEMYRSERARIGVLPSTGATWDRELTLALLTSPMRLGWLRAFSAVHGDPARRARDRAEIDYWAAQALAARGLLPG